MDNLNDTEVYTQVTDFARDLSQRWAKGLNWSQKDQLEELYTLCMGLIDEIAPEQVVKLPIESVQAFLIGTEKGHDVSEIVHCFLTSPSDAQSFRVLREIYKPAEEAPQTPLH